MRPLLIKSIKAAVAHLEELGLVSVVPLRRAEGSRFLLNIKRVQLAINRRPMEDVEPHPIAPSRLIMENSKIESKVENSKIESRPKLEKAKIEKGKFHEHIRKISGRVNTHGRFFPLSP